jgi:PKD repeat protein
MALIISAVAGTQLVNLATANPIPTQLPSITIKSDGSIDPSNATITKNGNIYTLTDNISSQTLDIQCNNTIIDGAGNTLQAGTFTADSGITIEANGVTVKNISINQYYDGVDINGSSNTITGTTIRHRDKCRGVI